MSTYRRPMPLVRPMTFLNPRAPVLVRHEAHNAALAAARVGDMELFQPWYGLRWDGGETTTHEWRLRPLGAPFNVVRVVLRGRAEGGGAEVIVRSATLPELDYPEAVQTWAVPVSGAVVESPPMLVEIDPDGDRLLMRMAGNGADVHVTAIQVTRPLLASPIDVAVGGVTPLGLTVSTVPGRPYHALLEQTAANAAETVGAGRPMVCMNWSATREPVAAHCGELASLPRWFSDIETVDPGTDRDPGWSDRLRVQRADAFMLDHSETPRGVAGWVRYGSGVNGGRLAVGDAVADVDPGTVTAWREVAGRATTLEARWEQIGLYRVSVEARSPTRPLDLPAAWESPEGDIDISGVALWTR